LGFREGGLPPCFRGKQKVRGRFMQIKRYEDFWRLCENCPNFHFGCALKCELRIRLKLPPHGPKYVFSGRVSEDEMS